MAVMQVSLDVEDRLAQLENVGRQPENRIPRTLLMSHNFTVKVAT